MHETRFYFQIFESLLSCTMNRLDRLTAILIQLQTKKIVKAEEIANHFEISLRTVYRDIKALTEAGVPVGAEPGKGYFIVDGFHLPPVMFTRDEASSMLLAAKLVEKMTDRSIQKKYDTALMKIKSVLRDAEKDHLESLQSHIQVFRYAAEEQKDYPDHFLGEIQNAIVTKEVLKLDYFSHNQGESTSREVEPIGMYYYSMAWHLIAWCRLRNGYRDFRTDRIQTLTRTGKTFDARNLISFQEYLKTIQANECVQQIVVLFDKPLDGFMVRAKHYYGYVSQEDLGDKVRIIFMNNSLRFFCKGILMHGDQAEIESPEEAKMIMRELAEELAAHYLTEVKNH